MGDCVIGRFCAPNMLVEREGRRVKADERVSLGERLKVRRDPVCQESIETNRLIVSDIECDKRERQKKGEENLYRHLHRKR